MKDAIKAAEALEKALGKLKAKDLVDGDSALLGAKETAHELVLHLNRQDPAQQEKDEE